MEFIGRITKYAFVRTIKKGNRTVISFTVTINDYYKPKNAEKCTKITTYVNCAHWLNSGIATYLVQGTLVEIHGRLDITAYMNKHNEPKANINCHVHATGTAKTSHKTVESELKEDMPF